METGHCYLIAMGSNRRRHPGGCSPRAVLGAALVALDQAGTRILRAAPVIASRPLGPSRRTYANSAALVETALAPEDMLALLQRIERRFGRRPGGRRWGERVLDLDIVLWDGGPHVSRGLIIPHPRFRERAFVLGPAVRIAPRWRDPLTGFTLRQLHARLTARHPRG